MKKITVLFITIFLAFSSVFSQPAKVTSAWNYLKNQQYDKAKENIEEAIKNEKTMALAKTWFFRGNIYLNIYLLNHTSNKGISEGMTKETVLKKMRKPVATRTIQVDNENMEQIEFKDDEDYKLFVNFKNNEVYSWSKEGPFTALDSGALEIAYDSYQKAIELDKEISDTYIVPMSPMIGLYIIGQQHFNEGVIFFNEKKFSDALYAFEKSAKINEIFGIKDTLATYYAANSAVLAKQNNKAKKYYSKLISLDYRSPEIYSQLANIYRDESDTLKALKTITLGRKRFPDDFSIFITETNIYISTGQIQKAQENLTLAVKKDSTNKVIYYNIGANYDFMHNIEQAEKAYLKAISLDSVYFAAIYNLGAMLYNNGVELIKQADTIPPGNNNYDKILAEGNNYFNKAKPYLERANEIQPNDIETLTSLRSIYTRLKMMDKLKEINQKLTNIK